MKTVNVTKLIILSLFFTSTSYADITLETVLDSLLKNNIELVLSQDNIALKKAELQEEHGLFDWTIQSEAGYQKKQTAQIINHIVTDSTIDNDVWSVSLGAQKILNNGIRIQPGIKYYDVQEDISDVLSQTQSVVQIGVAVPFLKGSGEEVLMSGIKAKQQEIRSAELNHQFLKAKLIASASRLYWHILAVDKELEHLREEVELTTELNQNQQLLVDQGEIAPIELLNAKSTLLLVQQKLNQTINKRDALKNELQQLTQDSAIPNSIFVSQYPELLQNKDRTADFWMNKAISQRLDLKSYEAQLSAQRYNQLRLKNSLEAQLDLNVNLDRVYLSYENTLEKNKSKGQLRRHNIAMTQLQLKMKQLKQQIKNEIELSFNKMQHAQSRYQISQSAINVNQAIYDDVEQRVSNGDLPLQSLITIKRQLSQSKQQQVLAQSEYALAIVDLKEACGDLNMDENLDIEQLVSKLMSL